MPELTNILVVQTAFIGDVILTLPMVERLKRSHPSANIDVAVIPRAAELMKGHPDVRRALVYDKRGADSGLAGFLRLVRTIRLQRYEVALVVHRSFRSAALAVAASIPQRIGFNSSAGKYLFTNVVTYNGALHEVDRNLQLLQPLGIVNGTRDYPHLYPSNQDRHVADGLLSSCGNGDPARLIGVAPGTVWNTKRWLKESFVRLISMLIADGFAIVLIGGAEDAQLCDDISITLKSTGVISTAGKCSLLQSAEIIRRCRVLVGNDSAPMHLALAMQTPVVAIFGATIPEYGFAPYGRNDLVMETNGLPCRPCSIHGGETCPVKTFDCMKRISAEDVYGAVHKVLNELQESGQ